MHVNGCRTLASRPSAVQKGNKNMQQARRELTHYRGEPDPFKGGVPSQKVRDMAREAIDALFNDNNYAEQASAPAPSLTVRFDGPSLSSETAQRVHRGVCAW